MEKKLPARRWIYDRGLRALLWLCGGLVCALLVFIIGYIFARGLPRITWELLSTQSSVLRGTVGILPHIASTVYIILVSMVIVLPLGVGAAIYLTEYATNRRLAGLIEFAAETLTGIPSIIYGLVGMMVFLQLMGLKAGILAGGLTLVVGIRPDGTVTGISFTELHETAGMGMRCDEPEFKSQFENVNVSAFTLNKGGASTAEDVIDSINGASVSSGAVVDAVNAALSYFAANLK